MAFWSRCIEVELSHYQPSQAQMGLCKVLTGRNPGARGTRNAKTEWAVSVVCISPNDLSNERLATT